MTRSQSLFIQLALFTSVVLALKGYQTLEGRLFTRPAVRKLRGSEKGEDERNALEVTTDAKTKVWRTIGSGESSGEECELQIVNDSHEPVIVCWVDRDLRLHHHYVLNDNSIRDGSVSNRHIEYTRSSHAFVCFRRSGETTALPQSLSEVDEDSFLFHCQLPSGRKTRLILELKSHNVPYLFRRKRRMSTVVTWRSERIIEVELLDTSSKRYEEVFLHGFCVKCEEDVFKTLPELQPCLEADLFALREVLPNKALRLLQQSTPFYLNKSLSYGPKASPITANSVCFHPVGGREWLRKHGLSEEKEGSIEIGSADDYLRSRGLWGTGGLLLHELCHAFHNKFCEDGYECSAIQEAYERAISSKLYESVAVHGNQGLKGPIKAYACTNCMEFFAELSVAFLYGKGDGVEYNKWFPFNREQLMSHDPDTFQVLQKIWTQHES